MRSTRGRDRARALAHDEVTFPMTRLEPVGHGGGAVVDGDHVAQMPSPVRSLHEPGPAHRATGPQPLVRALRQVPRCRQIDSAVDRLVRDPHARLVGMFAAQPRRDLLRGPVQLEPREHHRPQPLVARETRHPRPPGFDAGTLIGDRRTVGVTAAVAGDLARDRRRRPPQPFGDRPGRKTSSDPTRDLFPLTWTQVPWGASRQRGSHPTMTQQVPAHVMRRDAGPIGDPPQ